MFHHLAPHRRLDYVRLVSRALRPGGGYGLVCFRPEGGSSYTDQQVYERASLGGGLGYPAGRLPRAVGPGAVLGAGAPADAEDGQRRPRFGEDFLWVLLAAKAASAGPVAL